MKKKFSEFFPPEEKQIEAIWGNAIISPDANILYNLYRYSESTRDEFLGYFDALKEKLWISHQASVEFLSGRRGEIRTQIRESEEFEKTFKASQTKLNEKKAHPHLSKETENELESVRKKVLKELEESRDRHRKLLDQDWILEKLDALFAGRIGDELEDLDAVFKEGRERYKEKIPPGYQDDNDKPTNRQKFGDLVIWKELIRHAEKEKRPVIFITDDQKEDWFVKDDKKAIAGRPELIREMRKVARQDVLIYTADQFLWRAGEILKKAVTKETVEEVKRVGRGSWGAGMLPAHLSLVPEIATRMAELNQTTNASILEFAKELQGTMRPVSEAVKEAAKSARGFLGPVEMARLSLMAAENPEIMAKLQNSLDNRQTESNGVGPEEN